MTRRILLVLVAAPLIIGLAASIIGTAALALLMWLS